jgi:Methyltransferase domain
MARCTYVSDRSRDQAYVTANPGWHEDDAPWKADQVVRMLEKHHLVPRSMCDFGCGTAGVLDALRREVPTALFVGYEPSPMARALIPTERATRLRIVGTNPLDSATTFDAMLVLDVIEHVEDYMGLLRSLRTHASWFIFHIPIDLSAQAVLRESSFLEARRNLGHLHFFTEETARAVLEETGYMIVDSAITAPRVELPAPNRRTRLARPLRAMGFRLSPRLAARLLGGFELLVLAKPADETPHA